MYVRGVRVVDLLLVLLVLVDLLRCRRRLPLLLPRCDDLLLPPPLPVDLHRVMLTRVRTGDAVAGAIVAPVSDLARSDETAVAGEIPAPTLVHVPAPAPSVGPSGDAVYWYGSILL